MKKAQGLKSRNKMGTFDEEKTRGKKSHASVPLMS
jgi:hypothetical protein